MNLYRLERETKSSGRLEYIKGGDIFLKNPKNSNPKIELGVYPMGLGEVQLNCGII